MLVLSRKENQRIVFPTLDITVEVVRVQGSKTRLGIDAPPDIPVLRQEVADLNSVEFTTDERTANQKLMDLNRTVRERIDSGCALLNLLHQHLERDPTAQKLVLDVFQELGGLERAAGEVIEGDSKLGKRSPHALLLEQDENECQLLASCLRMNGFEVTTASDDRDALTTCRCMRPRIASWWAMGLLIHLVVILSTRFGPTRNCVKRG